MEMMFRTLIECLSSQLEYQKCAGEEGLHSSVAKGNVASRTSRICCVIFHECS